MNVLKNRALTLVAAVALAATACKGDQGNPGPAGQNGSDGTSSSGSALSSSGFQVTIKGVTVNPDQSVAVEFLAKDSGGNPVDLAGQYSQNAPIVARFSLSKVNVNSDGTVGPYTVLTVNGAKAYTDPTSKPDPATIALNPTALAPSDYPNNPEIVGKLVENGSGQGDYTYTFPTGGTYDGAGAGRYAGKTIIMVTSPVKVDPKATDTYVAWIESARQTNTKDTTDPQGWTAVNVSSYFVPAGGTPAVAKREVVATADCSKCHNGFKPDLAGPVSAAFHGGYRVDATYCAVCHNPARKSTATNSDGTTPAAASYVFVHRIHNAENLQSANVFDNVSDVSYPQDLRHCDACHANAAQGAQAQTTASRAVCGSCHDYVVFDPTKTTGLVACVDQGGVRHDKDANGNYTPCVHAAGANTDDNSCKGCHVQGGAGYIGNFHVPVVPPDPNNIYSVPVGGNNNTNAAFLAAAGVVPPGATQITYVVKSVSAFNDTSVTPNVLRPQIVFKLQQSVNGAAPTDVVFNTFGSGKTELIDGFVGSPSVYFAYSVPQDGITTPADFNATQSGYIKNIWNGAATGSGSGTIAGPDSSGFYTITLGMGPKSVDTTTASLKTGWQNGVACTTAVPCVCTTTAPCQVGAMIPAGYKMLTGGVGYTYGLTATQPLTQVNLPAYPYNADKTGGLLVPAPDVWMPADAKDQRRAIVDNAKCKNCHAALGAAPTFHAGQRNDGPTCDFCHNANQTNSGWSGNAKDFIHGLHAGLAPATAKLPDGATVNGGTGIRTVPFGWHATSDTDGYWSVTFPGQHNYCEACHASGGTYDFSAAASQAAIPNLLASTEVTGTVASATYGSSPYITIGNNYGSGFSVDKANGTITQAAATTLVTSPITAACVACHDSPAAKGHMVGNGGLFYVPRSQLATQQQTGVGEACLVCHGPGAIAAIADMHK